MAVVPLLPPDLGPMPQHLCFYEGARLRLWDKGPECPYVTYHLCCRHTCFSTRGAFNTCSACYYIALQCITDPSSTGDYIENVVSLTIFRFTGSSCWFKRRTTLLLLLLTHLLRELNRDLLGLTGQMQQYQRTGDFWSSAQSSSVLCAGRVVFTWKYSGTHSETPLAQGIIKKMWPSSLSTSSTIRSSTSSVTTYSRCKLTSSPRLESSYIPKRPHLPRPQ
ncbi:hypothetical protein FKM82_017245 [Ascaphus truei]